MQGQYGDDLGNVWFDISLLYTLYNRAIFFRGYDGTGNLFEIGIYFEAMRHGVKQRDFGI